MNPLALSTRTIVYLDKLPPKMKDWTGHRFGRLTIIKFIGRVFYKDKNRSQKVIWECLCDCGTITQVKIDALRSGNTQSCGCLNREMTIINNKKRALPKDIKKLNSNHTKYIWEAEHRKLEWALTKEEFSKIVHTKCHYCNGFSQSGLNGIDRVDNARGYVLDNVVPCCAICNRAKSTLDYVIFINKCKAIAKNRFPKHFRRFILNRIKDISGVSGVGLVASGCQFSSGQCVLHWETDIHSIETCASMEDLMKVHGHEGATILEWIDEDLDYDLLSKIDDEVD